MSKAALLQTIVSADRWAARLRGDWFGERSGLIALAFHAVAPYPADLARNVLDPALCLTLDQIRTCLEYYLFQNFEPIGVPQLLAGVKPGRNYVMFTFDDGYANNIEALDLLEAMRVPVLLSASTGFIRSGEAFWWDILHRHMSAAGATHSQIEHEKIRFALMPPAAIREELVRRYGGDALRPLGDLDRPMTPAELRAVAKRPLVTLGNHTVHHTYLPKLDADSLASEVCGAQNDLREFTGQASEVIVYPFGNFTNDTVAFCDRGGFTLGFSGHSEKIILPAGKLNGANRLQLPRHMIYPTKPILPQCESAHMDWKPSWTMRRWVAKAMPPKAPNL